MQTNRSNAGALIGGSILIGFGLLSLVSRLFRGFDWSFLWPIAIISFGAIFFIVMLSGGKNTAAFAIPGSIISGIGLVLLFQSLTKHWESMSYFWTFIIIFVGLGIYLMGRYGEEPNQRAAGLRLMRVGFILFIIFGAFFEMMFSSFGNIVFPVLLILLGIYLILARSGAFRKREDSTGEPMPPAS